MIELSDAAGFADEPLPHGLVDQAVRANHLDGYRAADAPVGGAIDRTHAASAELLVDLVIGQILPVQMDYLILWIITQKR